MQLLKHTQIFGAIGLLMLGLSPILAQTSTEETEARDKAKEQLNQKMAELEAQLQTAEASKPAEITAQNETAGQQAADTEAKAIGEIQARHDAEVEAEVLAAQAKVQASMAKPEVTQPEKTVAPALVVPAKQPTGDIEQARQQMRQKIVELDKPTAAQTQDVKPAPTAPAVKPATVKPVVVSKPPQPVTAQPDVVKSLPKVDSDRIAQARATMEQKINELNTEAKSPASAKSPVVTVPASKAEPVKNVTAVKSAPAKKESHERKDAEKQALKAATDKKAPPTLSAAMLMDAPPAAVSATKQQRLNDLLVSYKANKITPEEYHRQRAKILAEP